MSKFDIVNNVTRTFYKARIKVVKHSPEIMVFAGVVGVVTSTVLACKATTKCGGVIDDAKEQIDIFHKGVEAGQVIGKDENGEVGVVPYSEEDCKKDLAIVYVQTGVKLVKLYAPAVIIGALSITSILKSHDILRKRNIALAAAYTAVDKGFKEYRGRVIERFGQELDKELKYDIKAKEVEETVVDGKGKEKKIKKTIQVADPNTQSEYARFFDDGCLGWEKDAEHNLYTLRCVQNYANDKLQKQGYLFLNDLYEMLGIPKTKAGQVVGWIYDEARPNGDNYVDLGLYNVENEKARDFVNGRERTILIDPNVDGVILDLI